MSTVKFPLIRRAAAVAGAIGASLALSACGGPGATDEELSQVYGAQSCAQLDSTMMGVITLVEAEVITQKAGDELYDAAMERADELNCLFVDGGVVDP